MRLLRPKAKPKRSTLCWHFPDLDHGQDDGFNSPALEYFEGNHENYIAREAIQNSIDARLDYDSPVIVDFELREIPTSELPGRDELLERMQECLARSKSKGDSKADEHFSRAVEVLESERIKLLRIGDYNTSGLDGGDDDETSRWYRLVKSVGESRMSGVGGGSFGIGKGAPIAASKIRTVYYSTRVGKLPAFQGCASLITHKFDGKKRRGTGLFGEEGYKSLRDPSTIPAGFLRKEQGTDVFVAAYILEGEGENWESALVKSVLENFWMAIYGGDLEVRFANNTGETINSGSLSDYLQKHTENSAYQYYLAVTNPTHKIEVELPTLGRCKLYIKESENLAKIKKIALMRKPKMVVDRKSFRVLQSGYAGVFICDDDSGNKILRNMEPPQHDKWDKTRSPDNSKAISEMNEFIRDTLREIANAGAGAPEDIEDLEKYLPYEDESGPTRELPSDDAFADETGNEVGAEQDESYAEVKVVEQRSSLLVREGDESSSDADGGGDGGGGGGGGTQDGSGFSRIKTVGVKFRAIPTEAKNGEMQYCLMITSPYRQEGAIRIVAVGDDISYPVVLKYAKVWDSDQSYIVSKSFIKDVALEKDVQVKIRIGLRSNTKYALGIEIYEG